MNKLVYFRILLKEHIKKWYFCNSYCLYRRKDSLSIFGFFIYNQFSFYISFSNRRLILTYLLAEIHET